MGCLEKVGQLMPFLDDISADDEALQRPIWGVFVLVKDNLERLVAVNIGWSLQLLPAVAAFGFAGLPAVLRICMILYSATALAPATAILFVWMARANQHELPRLEMLREDFRALLLPGFTRLAPLFGSLGLCYIAILLLGLAHLLLLDVLARFALLVLLTCSLYWGPLFASNPERSPVFLLRQSLLLVWNYPGPTVVTGLVVLLMAVLGIVSVAGFFLIVPVVVALLQTRRCRALLAREQLRLRKFKVGNI